MSGLRSEENRPSRSSRVDLALTWADVDLAFGRISARRKLYRIGREQIWGDTKRHQDYTVSIPPGLVEELGRLKEQQGQKRLTLGEAYVDRGLVFCQINGRPLHLHNIGQRGFRAVVERVKLPRIRLYDLRHCHATHLARQGAPVTVTQSQLGHRNSSTTLRYYVHPMPDLQQEQVGRLAERLLGHRNGSNAESETAR